MYARWFQTLLLTFLGLALVACTDSGANGHDHGDDDDSGSSSGDDDDTVGGDDDDSSSSSSSNNDDDETDTGEDDGEDGEDGEDGTDGNNDGGGDDGNPGGGEDGGEGGGEGGSAPTGPCTDDTYEDNDSAEVAKPVEMGTYSNFVSCPEDEDWFAVELAAGEGVLVNINFTDEEGDIDTTFVDATGAVLDSSTSASDNEELQVTAVDAGTYYIKVTLFSDGGNDVGNAYDFEIAAPPECLADSYEVNNTAETAATVATNSPISSLNVCTGDADYYSFEVTTGQEVSVDLTFLDDQGDVDATLYDPDGTSVGWGGSVSDNELLGPHTATMTGSYSVWVRLYADAGTDYGNTYTMTVNLN